MTLSKALLLAGTALLSGYFGFRTAKSFVASIPDTSIPEPLKSRMYLGWFGTNLIFLLTIIIYVINGLPSLGYIRVSFWIFILSFDVAVFVALSKTLMSTRNIPLWKFIGNLLKFAPLFLHRIAKPDYYILIIILLLVYTIDSKESIDLAVILLFFIVYRAIRLFLDISSGQIKTENNRGPFGYLHSSTFRCSCYDHHIC